MPRSEKTTKTATATAETEPPEAAPSEKKRIGRPPKSEDRIPRVLSFFNRVSAIEKDDWGQRAFIKVYRLEPSIDRTRLGEPKHIAKYSEPIDEDRIKSDHGSGRYRLYLNFKAPTEKTERELDSMEIDILDMNFPPKLARGEWLDIPYNKKWEWCRAMLPKTDAEQIQQKTSATGDLVEALDVLDRVQSRAEDRMRPQQPQPNQTLDIIRGVKELMPPPPAPAPPATENKMLDTVVALLTKQIDRDATEAAELRKEIREMREKPNQEKKGPFGSLKDIVTEVKGILPDLKEMFPGFAAKAGELATSVARSRMSGDQEFWQPTIGKLVDGVMPIIQMTTAKFMSGRPPQPQPGTGQPGPQPRIPGAAPDQPPTVAAPNGSAAAPPAAGPPALSFLHRIAPALMNHLRDDMSGGDFAEWMFSGFGPEIDNLSWVSIKNAIGADAIVEMFRDSPYWQELQLIEAKFIKFVQEFCAWQPGAEEQTLTPPYEELEAN